MSRTHPKASPEIPLVNYSNMNLSWSQRIVHEENRSVRTIENIEGKFQGPERTHQRYKDILLRHRGEVATQGAPVVPLLPIPPRAPPPNVTKPWEADRWSDSVREYERTARGPGAGSGHLIQMNSARRPKDYAERVEELSLPMLETAPQTSRDSYNRQRNDLVKYLDADIRDRTLKSLPRKMSAVSTKGWTPGVFHKSPTKKKSLKYVSK
eukprot:PhF_6_TR30834/c0_g1_i1/m.45385